MMVSGIDVATVNKGKWMLPVTSDRCLISRSGFLKFFDYFI